MLNRLRQHTVAGTTIAVIALGTGGYAYAATTHHTRHHRTRHAANSTGTTRPANPETELTGDTADKAKAAALAAVPGGTVWRASIENPSDPSGAAYEVHVTKSDGSEGEVLEGSSFNVIATNAR